MRTMRRISSLSIMFPFLNDWGTVGSLVALAVQTVQRYTDDWEVVIVDDGSSEENREALEMIIRQIENGKQSAVSSRQRDQKEKTAYCQPLTADRRIHIIHHEKNRGYGGALRSGFSHCTKEFIFYTDCDAQYDPRELADLIEALPPTLAKAKVGAVGMVNGYKIKRHDPWYRTVAGRLYHHLVKRVFSLPIRDTDCDFRLIRREVFDRIQLFENTGTICVELVKTIDQAGFRIIEVPVHHYWRTSGKSQFFNFRRLFATGKNLGKLWWRLMIHVHEECT